MSIRPENIKKTTNTRLYHVTGKWQQDNKTYRQEFVIAARTEQDARQIGQNHIPLKIVQSTNSCLEINVRDYGIPQSNRTYYSSPILPNSYKPVMPGPIEQIPIAQNTIEEPDFTSPQPVKQKITQPVHNPEPAEPDAPKPTPPAPTIIQGMSDEEYQWASYFSLLWGAQLGRVMHQNTKLTKQERSIIIEIERTPNFHLTLKKWSNDFIAHMKKNKVSNVIEESRTYFNKQLATFIDEQIKPNMKGNKSNE